MTDCGILQHCSIGDWGSLVGGFASLVGSVLLYLTLKFQHKTFRQERFENVFFNMLDYHRKVTESIKIVVQEMEADTKIVSREYKGRTFFTFFERETGEIKKSLTSKKYLGVYAKFNDPISIDVAESKINEENLPEGYEEESLQKKQEVWDLYRTRYHNLIYDITPEKHELAKKVQNTDAFAYAIFEERLGRFYEQYLRSLRQMLCHICKHLPSKSQRLQYADYIAAQMTSQELRLVRLHLSRPTPSFTERERKVLEETIERHLQNGQAK